MKTARQLRTELARLKYGLAAESWQPLTADTVLPESGYLVLCDSDGDMCIAKVDPYGCAYIDGGQYYYDMVGLSANHTHYRVLRGPEVA